MKLSEALKQRIPRVRLSAWANPHAYLRLPLLSDNMTGPWVELYDESTQRDVLRITPGSQRMLIALAREYEAFDWEPYTGPVSAYEQEPENFARTYLEE